MRALRISYMSAHPEVSMRGYYGCLICPHTQRCRCAGIIDVLYVLTSGGIDARVLLMSYMSAYLEVLMRGYIVGHNCQ